MVSTDRPEHRWTYPCAVIRVVDGDTVDLLIDQGFKEYKQIRVRLYGIDTPERRQDGHHEATAYVYDWINNEGSGGWFRLGAGFPLLFESVDGDVDSFGRYLGRIWGDGYDNELGACLIEAGLAEEYE